MKTIRSAFGVAALALLVVGLNLLILEETLFTAKVLSPLLGSLALGLVWVILRLLPARGDAGSDSHRTINALVGSVLFLGICLTLYAFVKREDFSWDLTQEGRRDLAPQTKIILQSLTSPVEVTCFFVRAGDDRARIAQDKTRRFLERCEAYTDMLEIEFIDPQQNPERVQAINMLRVSNVGTVVVRSGARQKELPLSDVEARLEERDFTNAVLNVSRNAIPKVYFLTGHGERDVTDTDPKTGGASFSLWLQKEAHEVARFVIPVDNPAVPADCSVLVINGYKSDLHPHEIHALDQYVNDGGRMLILVDVQVLQESELPAQEQLRPWLKSRLGINVGSDIVVSKATDGFRIMFVPDFSLLSENDGRRARNVGFRGSFNRNHPITALLDKQLVLPVVRSVTLDEGLPDNTQGWVLLRSAPDTWAEQDLHAVLAGNPISRDPYESKGPNPVMVAVSTRSDSSAGEARVVLLGDADISSNEYINLVSNQDLLLNSIAWLTENEELIAVRPRTQEDQPLVLSETQQRAIAWIASLGSVQAIALAGIIVFLIRRKYR